MIGSNKKVRGVLEKLRKEGYSVEQLRNVFSPIGFEIGSHTPEEIAVSITAQMIAVKNGRKEIPFNSNPFNR
jgi:xanthine dehydrogenase accessory factor